MTIEACVTEVMGLRTGYLVAGSGPALVLLHGDGENRSDWQWVLPELARSHRVYAPDLPGAGATEPPLVPASVAVYARFVAAFLDTLGIREAVIVGHSLGGLVALLVAAADPARVTALVLVDSAGLGRAINPALIGLVTPLYGDYAIGWASTPPGALQRAAWRSALLFSRPQETPQAWLDEQCHLAQQPGFLRAALAALRAQVSLVGQREVVLDRLAALGMPTLVLWGVDDRIVPVQHGRRAVEQLPRGQLALIPDCGHIPHVERPTRWLAAVRPFLDTLAPRRATSPRCYRQPPPTPR